MAGSLGSGIDEAPDPALLPLSHAWVAGLASVLKRFALNSADGPGSRRWLARPGTTTTLRHHARPGDYRLRTAAPGRRASFDPRAHAARLGLAALSAADVVLFVERRVWAPDDRPLQPV
jgi:hypothetical protein